MRSSIDLLAEKIYQQLSRQHGRLLQKPGLEPRTVRELRPERPTRPETQPGQIAEVESWSGKPMTREEAALELAGSRQAFMVFEDAETGQLAVLTRRKDGDFKLILKE
jgi:putative sigma-54 modulation protein